MGEVATALRLLRAHVDAAKALLDALEPVAPEAPAVAGEGEPSRVCPCGETRDEKLEETPFADEGGQLQPRITCLTCGRSFKPEESNG